MAFDSGNLPHVAAALREHFPDKPLLVLGDDDQRVVAKHGRNPGRDKAEAAAQSAGGVAIVPIFAPGEQQADPKSFTDFNDLANKSSLGRAALERTRTPELAEQQQRVASMVQDEPARRRTIRR
jgi:phage/plasmid primase-like uncharacterized protein